MEAGSEPGPPPFFLPLLVQQVLPVQTVGQGALSLGAPTTPTCP